MVDCLRNQSSEALLDVLNRAFKVSFDPAKPVMGLVLGPVIDGDFVKGDPKILMSNKTSDSYRIFRSKDIMSGTMNGEGSLLLSFLKPYQSIFNFNLTSGVPKSVLCDHVAPVLVSDFYNGNSNISDAICKKYSVSNISDIVEQGRQIVSMYGDVMFISPAVKTLQIHSQGNNKTNSYMFHFTHHLSKAYGSPYPAWFKFASHATELAYLFAIPKAYEKNLTVSEKDIELSNNMLKYWTNFAKYGNPNGKSLPKWPEPEYHSQEKSLRQQNGLLAENDTSYCSSADTDKIMQFPGLISTCILSTILVHCVYADDTITVLSNSGEIKGVAVTEKNETVFQFRKIPYAKPPLRQLRFKKPEPYGTWKSTLDATQFGPSCVQTIDQETVLDLPNTNISEDCLFLNIYVPRNISKTNNMAVMIWIHGGSFLYGQGMLHDGSFLALSGNVIVVTINYRLNIFGFLSTGDDASVGNYGLWDQLEAIKWVRSNIFAFGGNPFSITIFGESAGSLSIGLHVLHPSDDLFQRAIMESGSGNSFLSYTKDGPSAAKLAGKLSSCDTTNSQTMVDCLRNQSIEALLDVLNRAPIQSFDPAKPVMSPVLGPVIDGDFVKGDPKILMSNKTSDSYRIFRSKDIMSGTMNGEGSLLLSFLKPYQSIFNFNLTSGIPKSVLCDHVAPVLVSDFYNGNSNISDAICKKYSVSNISDIVEQGRQIVSMYGDFMFISPAVKTLQIHSQGNKKTNSYMFHFTHQFFYKVYVSPYPAWFKFASHAAELAYLFAIPNAYEKNLIVSEQDIKLSKKMLKYWTNFAKYGRKTPCLTSYQPIGDPNGKSLPKWPEFKQGSSYLDLDLNITAKKNLYANRMDFWLKTIPRIAHQPIPISNDSITTET
ncbi:hypothetical protein KUTeg_003000 [Tegillarca granosa]|uniref:Carboxylesterase type B domain-containing protein n=1 Tax=Tegillarca granosa TaxID=220873 RepID=A0ABQ9FKV0_TEGGR|nr:hypothetical protein KUTeg_003000 [Tegillarca granosa]